MTHDKFMSIEVRRRDRTVFSSLEITTLTRKKFRSKRLRVARDIFLLAYYTGLSFAVIKELRYTSLILDDEGGIWIKICKTKRGSYEVILLIKEAKVILDKYIPPFTPSNNIPLIPASMHVIDLCSKYRKK